MRVLGIETSCDETAAAVVENGSYVLSNVVASQIDVHKKYGGVVPELASRAHLEAVLYIIEEALTRADVTLDSIDAVAVTQGPGLIGALMVGVHTAKSLAYARDLPLVAVNHIEAHLHAIRLSDEQLSTPPEVPHPFVALAVSGGHTSLYHVQSPDKVVTLGQTLDDAAGEAYDKVSKMLGLGYPGGPVIDKLASVGNRDAIAFPRAWLGTRHNDFSFSGLKTSVRYHLKEQGVPSGSQLNDLCASFQESVVHVLVKKTLRAARQAGVDDVVVAGGVASNSRLREAFAEKAGAGRSPLNVHIPPLRYCTDNAAMIAGLGYVQLSRGRSTDVLSLDARASMAVSGGA
jgi:N6-L-threonylcarbamoyladenine synthase